MRSLLFAIGMLALAGGAGAQPRVSTEGVIGPEPLPSSFGPANTIHLYFENSEVLLDGPLGVDVGPTPMDYGPGSEPAGDTSPALETVTCVLLHFQPPGDGTATARATGRVFMEDGAVLLGIAWTDETLQATDSLCGPPGVDYSVSTAGSSRGLGFGVMSDFIGVGTAEVDLALAARTGGLDQLRLFVGSAVAADAGAGAADGGVGPRDAGGASRSDAGARVPAHDWDYRGGGGCTCTAVGQRSRARLAPIAAHAATALVVCGVLRRRRRA